MLDRVSIAWRIGFALIWEALCLWLYAVTYKEYWPFVLGVCGAGAAVCLGHFGRLVMGLVDAFRALWQSPETPEYEHTVDGVRAAALRVHNWASRNAAAAIGISSLALVTLTGPGLIKFLICSLAIVAATHWPAIMARFRSWGTRLEAAE